MLRGNHYRGHDSSPTSEYLMNMEKHLGGAKSTAADTLAKLTAEAPTLLAKLDSDIVKIGKLSAALDEKFAASSQLLDDVIASRREPAR